MGRRGGSGVVVKMSVFVLVSWSLGLGGRDGACWRGCCQI